MEFSGSDSHLTDVLPASPNWYCSSVIDVSSDGILVYGARSDLNILMLRGRLDLNTETSSTAHITKPDDNDSHALDGCVCRLIETVSRVHRERITTVRIVEQSCTTQGIVTASEDGRIKYFVYNSQGKQGKQKSLLKLESEYLPSNTAKVC